MERDDLCFAGAAEQAELVSTGQVSAVELTSAMLERIDEHDLALNAYRDVLADRALDQARALDATNTSALPLAGVPIAVKDTIAVEGSLTTMGTGAVDRPAAKDAPIVAALRQAGAIIIGKTTCSELAVWPFTETPTWGQTRNPWNLDYSPGGSSGGSGAAVAAGLCGLAVGSDGLGSIRAPSSFNGVFGIKPQRGRVWHGPMDWHGMAVNGPLARTVADAALFLDVTAQRVPDAPFTTAIEPTTERLRIAIAWKSAARWPTAAKVGDEQRAAVEEAAAALRELGHQVTEREIGYPESVANGYFIRYLAGVAESRNSLDRPDDIEARTRRIANHGQRIPKRLLRWALANEQKSAQTINKIFDHADIVLTPGAVLPPLKIGQLDGYGASRTLYESGRRIPHFAPWNAIGQPAMSVPMGLSALGLPLSVQFAAGPDQESVLLRLAAELETVRPWVQNRPPL